MPGETSPFMPMRETLLGGLLGGMLQPTLTPFFHQYNTALSPDDEQQFGSWLLDESARRGRNMGRDLEDYDLRGWFLNPARPVLGGAGHLPDTYKKPNHPTFSTESIYHQTPSPWGSPFVGGSWGQGTFQPSPFMLQYTHPLAWLMEYFRQREPGTQLLPPRD